MKKKTVILNSNLEKVFILTITWILFIITIIAGIGYGNQYQDYTIMLSIWAGGFVTLAIGLFAARVLSNHDIHTKLEQDILMQLRDNKNSKL